MSALDKAWSVLKNEGNTYPQQPSMVQVPCPHCEGSGVTHIPNSSYARRQAIMGDNTEGYPESFFTHLVTGGKYDMLQDPKYKEIYEQQRRGEI